MQSREKRKASLDEVKLSGRLESWIHDDGKHGSTLDGREDLKRKGLPLH